MKNRDGAEKVCYDTLLLKALSQNETLDDCAKVTERYVYRGRILATTLAPLVATT